MADELGFDAWLPKLGKLLKESSNRWSFGAAFSGIVLSDFIIWKAGEVRESSSNIYSFCVSLASKGVSCDTVFSPARNRPNCE
jgi:hypothetical protein